MTGDQIDRSGIEQQWKDYYTYIPSISTTLQANLPGNHEYYADELHPAQIWKFAL